MIVGLDFDNTIVSYDALFQQMAIEEKLVPNSIPPTKTAIRDYLRHIGKENFWTELQSRAYGPFLKRAIPFPGVFEFLSHCRKADISIYVVSHKTQFPYQGTQYNLHESALEWMFQQGFMCQEKYGLSEDRVFFEPTATGKCYRIRSLKCDVFLDDLPEFLLSVEFPSSVHRVLFDPHQRTSSFQGLARVGSWREFLQCMLSEWSNRCVTTA
ncbi:MAG: hypothetical protein NPIRA02_03140 [Nitrospirales bacterium]|nr:MAG: hypothetical protein NPIRA02_03140 [Nitrospirales bacterium]